MAPSYVHADALELGLNDVLRFLKPEEEDVLTRIRVIDDIRNAVLSTPSLKGAIVEPFGSYVSNLYTRYGDLDMSVEVRTCSDISSTKKKIKLNSLRNIMRAVQSKGIAWNVRFIPSARVPLLVFQSSHRNISCDISIGNWSGIIKSKFLLWLSKIDERFRDMVLLVKEWAKSQDINDSKIGTFNSYSLTLLVIFHFQTCKPAIFPPLNEIYEGNMATDLKGVRVDAEKHIKDICSANIAKFRKNFKIENTSSIGELFVSFLKKFSQIKLEYVLCPYSGQWEHKQNKPNLVHQDYYFHIEDPLEKSENTARAVGAPGFARICIAFKKSHDSIVDNIDRSSMISSVLRPQYKALCISRIAGGIPIVRPQISGPTPAPAIQSVFHNTRIVIRPPDNNYYSQRSVTTVPLSQTQFQNTGLQTHPAHNGYRGELVASDHVNQYPSQISGQSFQNGYLQYQSQGYENTGQSFQNGNLLSQNTGQSFQNGNLQRQNTGQFIQNSNLQSRSTGQSFQNSNLPSQNTGQSFQNGNLHRQNTSQFIQNGNMQSRSTGQPFQNGKLPSRNTGQSFHNGNLQTQNTVQSFQNGNLQTPNTGLSVRSPHYLGKSAKPKQRPLQKTGKATPTPVNDLSQASGSTIRTQKPQQQKKWKPKTSMTVTVKALEQE